MKEPDARQQEAIAKAVASRGFIVRGSTGTGKTLVGVEIAKQTRTPGTWRALVVAPNKAVAQWVRMIEDQDPGINVVAVPNVPLDFNLYPEPTYFVIGYSGLLYHPLMRQIDDVLWDIVIVDEAHRIKNRKAKQTATVWGIPRARSVALTATPMEKSPADLWSILHFVAPGEFQSFWPFAKRWIQTEQDWLEHWVFGPPIDPEEFAKMLTDYMYGWPLDTPYENVVENIPVKMAGSQEKLYHALKAEKDLLFQYEGQEILIPNALALLTRIQQISTHPPLLGFGIDSGKMQWLKEFVDDHPDSDILVFTRFRDAAFNIGARFDGDVVVGGIGDGELFKKGERRMCVGTIDAMGESLDGFQKAKYAIFIDAHWSTIKMTQALGRIFRKGITENKETYMLYSCHEDELVLQAIERKWTEAELVYYFMQGDNALDSQTD